MKARTMKRLVCAFLVTLAAPAWAFDMPHVANLSKEDFALTQFFVGAGFKLLLFNMNAEIDRTGPLPAKH